MIELPKAAADNNKVMIVSLQISELSIKIAITPNGIFFSIVKKSQSELKLVEVVMLLQ